MTPSRLKYNNKPTVYNGKKYASKREAKHAQDLDWRIKSGEVTKWVPQVKIPIIVDGKFICHYIIDFKVWLVDGSIEYHEVKGKELQLWKLKWALTKAIYPDMKLILVK
jgi:hypothetical protein